MRRIKRAIKQLCFGAGMAAVVVILSGCSWQDTVLAVQHAPKTLRLANSVITSEQSRWRIAAGSRVCIPMDESVPAAWAQAARAGFAKHFRASFEQRSCMYTLHVQWPAVRTNFTEQELSGSLLGLPAVPRLARTGVLYVHIEDAHRVRLNQVALKVSPALYGEEWHTPAQLELAFADLADALVIL